MLSSSLSIVDQLNDLLFYLNLPITLQSPTDLTPSLILALLESILKQRLSGISTDIRTCRSEESRILCVKMVLGILQTDILAASEQEQLNEFDLTGVNPENLARGGAEEVVRIARVLCWLGERAMITERQSQFQVHRDGNHCRSDSLSTSRSSTATSKSVKSPHSSTFSPSSRRCADFESNTSVQDLNMSGILPHLSSFEESLLRNTQRQPQCIHEVRSPSPALGFRAALASQDSSGSSLSFPLTPICLPPVRQNGFIGDVHEEDELESFERSRVEKSGRSHVRQYDSIDPIDFEEVGHARTIALLRERARLLYRLAKFQQGL